MRVRVRVKARVRVRVRVRVRANPNPLKPGRSPTCSQPQRGSPCGTAPPG